LNKIGAVNFLRYDLIVFQNFQNCDFQMIRIRIRFRLTYSRSHAHMQSDFVPQNVLAMLLYDYSLEYKNVP